MNISGVKSTGLSKPRKAGQRSKAKKSKRGSYAVITGDVRTKLIKMVLEDRVPVPEATKRLKINYNTGKQIITRFLNSGHITDGRYKTNRDRINTPVYSGRDAAAKLSAKSNGISMTRFEAEIEDERGSEWHNRSKNYSESGPEKYTNSSTSK